MIQTDKALPILRKTGVVIMSIKEIRKKAFSLNKGNLSKLWLMLLIVSAVSLACGLLSACFGLGSIASLIITPPFTLGICMTTLKLVRNKPIKPSYVYDGFNNFGKSIFLNLTNGLFAALWSLLFIIPGIIKEIEYSMSFFLLADNPDWSISDARSESIRIMQGNRWRYFCLQLSFLGWLLLSVLTLGILSIWVIPALHTAEAVFYEDIKPRKVKYVPIEEEQSNNATESASV